MYISRLPLENLILESVETFTKARKVLPTIIRRNTLKKVGTASEDYLTRQIVTTPKLLELVINGSEKNSETRLLSSQLKR